MAIVATLIYDNLRVMRGLDASQATLVYVVTAEEADPPLTEATALAAVPLALGDPLPSTVATGFAGVCTELGVVRWNGPRHLLVAAAFSTRRWGAAPQGLAEDEARSNAPIILPLWCRLSGNPADIRYNLIRQDTANRVIRYRPVIVRSRSIPLAALDDATIDAALANKGKLYDFGGVPYLLDSIRVVRSTSGRSRVNYQWVCFGNVKGLAANTVGFNLAIPDLGPLEEYAPLSEPYTIGKLTVAQQYVSGTTLPGMA